MCLSNRIFKEMLENVQVHEVKLVRASPAHTKLSHGADVELNVPVSP